MIKIKICVCGTGNIGLAAASDLSFMGHEITVFELEQFKDSLEPLKAGEIKLSGKTQSGQKGAAKISNATLDPKEAVDGADLIIVATPYVGHLPFVQSIAPHLNGGQIVFVPTGYWSSLRSAPIMKKAGKLGKVIFAEGEAMVYLANKKGANRVKIFSTAEPGYKLATFPADGIDKAYEAINKIYPQYQKAPNIIWPNLARANKMYPSCINYIRRKSKASKVLCKNLAESLFKEKIAVSKALGFEEAMPPSDSLIKSPFGWMPLSIQELMMREDVPGTFVSISELGDVLGINMDTTKAAITLMGLAMGTDPKKEGIMAADLGIEGKDADKILSYVTTGTS